MLIRDIVFSQISFLRINFYSVNRTFFKLFEGGNVFKDENKQPVTTRINKGNIKAIEKELGISYPTVKKNLEEVIVHLGYEVSEEDKMKKEDIQRNFFETFTFICNKSFSFRIKLLR